MVFESVTQRHCGNGQHRYVLRTMRCVFMTDMSDMEDDLYGVKHVGLHGSFQKVGLTSKGNRTVSYAS